MAATADFGRIVVLKKDGSEGAFFCVQNQDITIGRDKEADIRIKITTVSKTHARIYVDENGNCNLLHLSKTNPTVVNGECISNINSTVALVDGDKFVVGEREFLYQSNKKSPTAGSIAAHANMVIKHVPVLETIDESQTLDFAKLKKGTGSPSASSKAKKPLTPIAENVEVGSSSTGDVDENVVVSATDNVNNVVTEVPVAVASTAKQTNAKINPSILAAINQRRKSYGAVKEVEEVVVEPSSSVPTAGAPVASRPSHHATLMAAISSRRKSYSKPTDTTVPESSSSSSTSATKPVTTTGPAPCLSANVSLLQAIAARRGSLRPVVPSSADKDKQPAAAVVAVKTPSKIPRASRTPKTATTPAKTPKGRTPAKTATPAPVADAPVVAKEEVVQMAVEEEQPAAAAASATPKKTPAKSPKGRTPAKAATPAPAPAADAPVVAEEEVVQMAVEEEQPVSSMSPKKTPAKSPKGRTPAKAATPAPVEEVAIISTSAAKTPSKTPLKTPKSTPARSPMPRSPVCPPAPVVVVAEEDIIVVQEQQEVVMASTTAEKEEDAVAEEEEQPVVDVSSPAAVESVEGEGEACAASLEQEEVVAAEEQMVADDVEPVVAESLSSLSPLRRAVESRRKSVNRLSLSAAMATTEVVDTTTTIAAVDASATASPVPVPAPVAVVVVCRDTQKLFTSERPRSDRRASLSSARDSASASHPLSTTTTTTTTTTQKRKSIAAPHFRSVAREMAPSSLIPAPATTEVAEGEGCAEEELGEENGTIAMVESSEPMLQAERCDYVEVDEEVVVTGSQVAAPSDLLEASSASSSSADDEMVTTTITTTPLP